MKLFTLILIVLASVFSIDTYSQNITSTYSTAIGVKTYPGSITFKKNIGELKYVEGQAAFWNKGFRATLLYEIHNEFANIDGLRWYYGFGPHLGFYNNKFYNGSTLVGVDGVLGLDYKISGIPFNVSLDWQPSFEFGTGPGFEGWGGIGIRYTF
jgi:hypothetical protein